MKLLYTITVFSSFVLIALIPNVRSENTTTPTTAQDDKVDKYDPSQPYCFRFTWLGPSFDQWNEINTTCDDYLDNTRAVGVPCRQPLVYTHDGTPPDLDYLWNNHRKSVICRQSTGQVCVKYSYKYDNALQNVTYMCTKVRTKGEGAVTHDTCYKQIIDEYEVELCVCKSQPGPYIKPCNSAINNFVSVNLMIVAMFLVTINFYLHFPG